MTESDEVPELPEGYTIHQLRWSTRWFWKRNDLISAPCLTRDLAILDAHRHKQERESGRE